MSPRELFNRYMEFEPKERREFDRLYRESRQFGKNLKALIAYALSEEKAKEKAKPQAKPE